MTEPGSFVTSTMIISKKGTGIRFGFLLLLLLANSFQHVEAEVGSSCTSSNQSNCTTGEECKNNITCSCKDGYANNSSFCTAGNGYQCNVELGCSDKYATCDAISNICKCTTGYTDSNGDGSAVGTIGGLCKADNGYQCNATNVCNDKYAICDAISDICKCTTGYTDSNGDGSAVGTIGGVCKADNGYQCNATNVCNDKYAACDAISNICKCTTGYTDSNGDGSAVGTIGGVCKAGNGYECNATNVCNDKYAACDAISNICKCTTGYTDSNGDGSAVGTIGGVCKAGNGYECNATNVCNDKYAACDAISNICKCTTGYTDSNGDGSAVGTIGGVCKAGNGYECNATNVCNDKYATCDAISNICKCTTGYTDRNGDGSAVGTIGGVCKAGNGYQCNATNVCNDKYAACDAISNICKCTTGYTDSNGDGSAVGTIGGVCKAGNGYQCNATNVCNDKYAACDAISNICKCTTGYTDSNGDGSAVGTIGGVCKAGNGYQCDATNVCNDKYATCDAISNICKCTTGYTDSNGDGSAVGTIGGVCKAGNGYQCDATNVCNDKYATCDAISNICKCTTGYTDSNGDGSAVGTIGGVCKAGNGYQCDATNVCNDKYATCDAISNICKCTTGYTDSNGDGSTVGTIGGVCKAGNGYQCDATNVCNDKYATCDAISNICKCTTGYTDSNGDGSAVGTIGGVCKAGNGFQCDATNVCNDKYATCDAISNICKCTTGYTDSNGDGSAVGTIGGVCKAGNGYQCDATNICSDMYATCDAISNTCKCSTGYTDSNGDGSAVGTIGGVCNANLGSPCGTRNGCSNKYAVCTGTCQCGAGYYNTSGDNCTEASLLAVRNLHITSATENVLVVQWENPLNHFHVSKYKVTWERLYNVGSPGHSSIDVSKDANSANISTNLIDGAAYNITVSSYQNSILQTNVSTQNSTRPFKPGPLNVSTDNLDLDVKGLTLVWNYNGTLKGVNVVFKIELIDSNTNTTVQLNDNISMTVFNTLSTSLKYGHKYIVKITARSEEYGSGLRINSDTYEQWIKTVAKVPGPPSRLTCSKSFDRSIQLSWSIPDMPNGDIIQYLVETNDTVGVLLKSENTSSNATAFEVQGLYPGTRYSFKVYTQNEVGRENTGIWINNCSTVANMSGPPASLNASEVTSRSFTITWSKPNEVYGQLLGYVLRITTTADDSCVLEELTKCPDVCGFPFPSFNVNCLNGSNNTKIVGKNDLAGAQSYNGTFNPDTEYTVSVTAVNQGGMGYPTVINLTTKQEAPQKPVVTVVSRTSKEANISWNISGPRPGQTTYTISCVADSPAENKTSMVIGFLQRSFALTGLQEFWKYSLTVTASTINGSNESSPVNFTTEEGPPGNVSNLEGKPGSGDKKYITSQVSWQLPLILDRNGIIKTFYIQQEEINGANANRLSSTNVTALLDDAAQIYVETFQVEPEKTYRFTVIAYNGYKGNERIMDYKAPAGPPFIPDEQKLEVIPPSKVSGVGQRSFVIEINTDFFMNDTNGKITDKGLICCEDPICSNDSSSTAVALNLPTYAMARKQRRMKYKLPVPIVNLTSIPSGSGGRRKRESGNVYQYSVGTEICDNNPDTYYCNGPLDPGSSYRIIAFVCTNGGCTLSKSYGPFITLAVPKETGVSIGAAVGGGVGGGLAVILIAIIVIVIMRKRNKKRKRTRKALDDSNDPSHMENLTKIKKQRPIKLANFAEYVADYHKDSNLKFSEEYEDLKTLSPQHSHEAADMEENRLKNRFVNILPFDHSRVRLLPIDDVPGSDYINANFLPGFSKTREYIACQGPIPATIDDHWRLIWEQNVRVIVMLTQYKEENRVKCEPYMPLDLKDPKQYGDLVVECLTYSSMNSFEYRTLKIRLGEKERTIKHFHFLSWRDYSANVQFDTMIDFIKKVRSFIQPPDVEGPMIVHCSAGVGRTGTYITIDHVIQHIDKYGPDSTMDIFNFVLKMRENRTTMVQTEQQYIFIHDCIKEYLDRFKTYENQAFSSEDENLYQNTETIELYQNVPFNSTQKTEL